MKMSYDEKIKAFVSEWKAIFKQIDVEDLKDAMPIKFNKNIEMDKEMRKRTENYISALPGRIRSEIGVMSFGFEKEYIPPRITYLKEFKSDLDDFFPSTAIIKRCSQHCKALIKELNKINADGFVSEYYKQKFCRIKQEPLSPKHHSQSFSYSNGNQSNANQNQSDQASFQQGLKK
jgi:hypothetical protein